MASLSPLIRRWFGTRHKPFPPDQCVVPIVESNPDGSCGRFLGTGFFTGRPPILVTCAHVIRDVDQCGIIARDHPGMVFPANKVAIERASDLATLRIADYLPPRVLPLAKDDEIVLNRGVCCFEYGTTTTVKTHIDFSPANRLGNVTRTRNLTDRFSAAGDRMLELSFPALQGASGAPIVDAYPPHAVWGVVTANTAYEIHPAQVEKIIDADGRVTEETRFYLPQALAIHVQHVRTIIRAR